MEINQEREDRDRMKMESKQELLQQIEKVRRILHDFAFAKSLVAPEVVELSQRLDSLLNQYYQYGQTC